MATRVELDYTIETINSLLYDYIEYVDSLEYTESETEKEYFTSETILANVKKTAYTSIQQLGEDKKDSLSEYVIIPIQDTTIFNLCFEIYGVVDDETFDKIIIANDLMAFDRTDIDPNDPIIKKGTRILYYK